MAEALKEREAKQARRNLNPTAEAYIAMNLWSREYAHEQHGGSMDFWDNLSDWQRKHCRQLVERIKKTESAVWREPLVKASPQAALR